MKHTIDVLGISFANKTLNETVTTLSNVLDEASKEATFHVATVNPEMAVLAQKNRKFKVILSQAKWVTADGIGIVFGSKYLNTPLPERVTGYDTLLALLSKREREGKSTKIYCVGSTAETIHLAVEKLRETYREVDIVGFRNGYFEAGSEEEQLLVEDIASKSPDLLLVGLGSPKQEEFIYTYRDKLQATVSIGIGGAFDVLSGKVLRSPELFQTLHLEWFWRLIKEPRRLKRQLAIPVFVYKVLQTKHKKA